MNCSMKIMLVPLLLAGLFSGQAGADISVENQMQIEMDQALNLKGDPGRGKEAFIGCHGCHHKDASGRTNGAQPRLAGQHATVLIKQMIDIRSGLRRNSPMNPAVSNGVLSLGDIADIAAYLQQLPAPEKIGLGPGKALETGKALYARDCAACHGEHGEGNAEMFYPMVAGQHYKYLLREARMIGSHERHNANPDMTEAIKSYSDEELEAVADYMARLPTRQ